MGLTLGIMVTTLPSKLLRNSSNFNSFMKFSQSLSHKSNRFKINLSRTSITENHLKKIAHKENVTELILTQCKSIKKLDWLGIFDNVQI